MQHCMLKYDRNRVIVVDLENKYAFDEKVWRYLVKDMNVNLNLIDDFGDTPLTLAIKLHRQEVTNQLLSNNRVRMDLMSDRRPPFHIYCEEGILEVKRFNQFMMRTSLFYSNLCQRNYEGKTVLHCLLNNQAGIESPRILFKPVANLLESEHKLLVMQDAAGDTPLMTAITRGYPFELLQLLIPGSSEGVNLVNHLGFNALALSLLRFQGQTGYPDQNYHHYQSPTTPGDANYDSERTPYRDKWRWDHQMSGGHLHGSQHRRHSNGRSPQQGSGGGGRGGANGRNGGVKNWQPDEESGPAERDLHQLINALTQQHGRLDRAAGFKGDRSYGLKNRQSILSFVIHNKKLTHRTMKRLLDAGLITHITCRDIQECVIEFRLDLLDELMDYAAETNNVQMTDVINEMEGLAINLLDHVYTFRHIYTVVRRQQAGEASVHSDMWSGVRRETSPGSGLGMRSGGTSKALITCDAMSDVSRLLARQNLSRVKPLICRLFDHFGHDVNHVIKQVDPHTKQEVESFTLIHALIQSNSWIELPDVVDYILREKGSQLKIDVLLPGRGTPINYAIRLGQFGIADRILDLNPDLSQLDLAIPVLPLKRNFSDVMRRLLLLGVQIPREFGIQNIRTGIDDAKLEIEFFDFLSEARTAHRRSASRRHP